MQERLIDVFRRWRLEYGRDYQQIPTDEEAKEISDYLDDLAKFKAELRIVSMRIEMMHEDIPPDRPIEPERTPPSPAYRWKDGEWVKVYPEFKLTGIKDECQNKGVTK